MTIRATHGLAFRAALGLLAWCLLAGDRGAAAETLSLVTGAGPPLAPDGEHPGFTASVAREAFSRLGIDVSVTALPAERAIVNVNAGLDDGDLTRVAGLEAQYPNLVRVPESMMTFEFVGYTTGLEFPASSWAALRPYAVGMVTGWKIYESNVVGVAELVAVSDATLLFTLLKNRRADVVLYDRWQGLWTARQLGIPVHVLAPPFASQPLFMYLNCRWAPLVPRLAQAIAGMKADGSYDRMFRRILQPLEQQADH